MAQTIRGSGLKQVPLFEIQHDLSRFLSEAQSEEIVITRDGKEIVITRDGKPAGVLIGFASEEDWFDYQPEHDPRFLGRIEHARKACGR